MKRGLIIIAALFLITALALSYFDRGREPGPIEVAEYMRARACSAELQGFNEYIDKEAVEHSLKRSELERMRKDFVYSSVREPDGSLRVKDTIVNTVPELLSLKWQLFNDQVRAGRFGPICNMELVRVGRNESAVKIKFPGGERSTWGFGKVGQEWKLVSIQDVMPLRTAVINSFKEPMVKNLPGPEVSPGNETVASVVNDERTEPLVNEIRAPAPDREKEIEAVLNDIAKQKSKEDGGDSGVEEEEETRDTAALSKEQAPHTETIIAGSDFRNASWGMTPAQVEATEGTAPGRKGPGELVFNTYYKGESVNVRYKFSDNGLKSGGVVFLNEHPEEVFYVQDYVKRRGDLTAKYGEPLIDEEIWFNRLYEAVPERMGFAVAIGHLKLRTKWSTASSDILLELKSENYNMTLVLSYHSR